jgi:hypothetical protein
MEWLWADSNTAGVRAYRGSDNSLWTSTIDIDHAFTLNRGREPIPTIEFSLVSGF